MKKLNLFRITPVQEAFEIIYEGTNIEGGYVNNPDDLGKATNWGITQKTALEHQEFWPLYNWDGNMETMPKELAFHIYYLSWWRRLKLDRVVLLSRELAELMFDFGINAGRRNCIKSLQEILNVHNRQEDLYEDLVVDGIMGGKTLTAITEYCDLKYSNQLEKLLFMLHCERSHHYIQCSLKRERNETFQNGWTERAYTFAKKHKDVMFK